MWTNENFRITFVIFTILNGGMNCQIAVITQLVEPFGFNSVDSSLMGSTAVAAGFISSLIFPFVIQKYKWYLKSMSIMATGSLVAQICLLLTLITENRSNVLGACVILGCFNLPGMPVVYSYATETTYPAPEVLFGSILQVGSSLFSSLFSYVALFLIQ